MVLVAIIIIVFLGVALALGAVIAIIASRKAPDGFEDRDGFHVGRLPPAPPPK